MAHGGFSANLLCRNCDQASQPALCSAQLNDATMPVMFALSFFAV